MCNIKHSSSFVWRKFEGEPFTTLESFALALFPPHTQSSLFRSWDDPTSHPTPPTHSSFRSVSQIIGEFPWGSHCCHLWSCLERRRTPPKSSPCRLQHTYTPHKRTNSSLNSISDLHLRTLLESNYIRTYKHAHTHTHVEGFPPKR